MTISRIWRGYTTPENAEAYQSTLLREVIPGIEAMAIPGCHGVEVFRRDRGDEVEFLTIMRFDSLDDVKAFVGEDHEVAHVPEAARAVLKRFDARSVHYEVVKPA